MCGYIKENIPKCMTFTVSYSQLMDTSPCINIARRTTFLTTSVRISPAYFTENLLSHRSSLNRFLFVSLLWHFFIVAPKADIIIFLSTFKTGRCRRSVQLTNFRCSQG